MATLNELREMHPEPSGREGKAWPKRVDVAVDEIASMLGLEQITYKTSPEATHRYIAPYRLELLVRELEKYKVLLIDKSEPVE